MKITPDKSGKSHLRPPPRRRDDGRTIMGQPPEPAPDLAALLADITDANRHELIDAGLPTGRESW